MKCKTVQKNLSAYADGELSARLRRRVAAHLSLCEQCSAELSRLEEITGMAKASLQNVVCAAAPPPNLRDAVMRATEHARMSRSLLIRVGKLATATIIVVLLSGLLVGAVFELRFRSEREAFRKAIADRGRALVAARNDFKTAHTRLIEARARLSMLQEELRLARGAAAEGTRFAARAPGGGRLVWRPILSSLEMPGAKGLLENGLF